MEEEAQAESKREAMGVHMMLVLKVFSEAREEVEVRLAEEQHANEVVGCLSLEVGVVPRLDSVLEVVLSSLVP